MIPESEWKFFEATEQRVKHLYRHGQENLAALLTGGGGFTDPAGLAARAASILQELDYPARVEAAIGSGPSPAEARHLDLHRRWILGVLFSTHPEIQPVLASLTGRMVSFRPRLGDREVTWGEVRRVLREEADRDRREEAFYAAVPLGEAVREDLATLFRLREALARAVAGAGFPQAAYHALDQERTAVVSLLDELERTTRKAFDAARRSAARGIGERTLEPWDYAYAARAADPIPPEAFPAAEALAEARAQAVRWGFAAEADAVRVLVADVEEEGVTLAIELPGDVRVLAVPAAGPASWRAVFHAFGRAIALASVRARRHFLEQDTPAMIEAAGALFARTVRDPERLARRTGADACAVEAHLDAARLACHARLRLHHLRHAFENVAYAHADVEPHGLYMDVLEQTLSATRRPAPLWATHPAFVARPLETSSVILGELAAAQLAAALASARADWIESPETGARLREAVFAPGAAIPWGDRIESVTGSPLDIDALRVELGAERFTGPGLEDNTRVSDEEVEEYFKDIDLSDVDLE